MKKSKKIFTFSLALTVTLGSVPVTARAETGTKPEDGTTIGQPFPSGTGGSQNFRIPGLVTLDDGTLVASCDARWNHGGDACGLDTVVSRSTDHGATWNYTFANYLGDYGNQMNQYSSAFIDPAIATDGETVYMIADVWPGGYAINTAPLRPVAGQNGFDANGNLRLSADNRSTYGYHLEKNTGDAESYYVIKENATGNVVEGYTVDAYFNLTGNGVTSNLFYYDSPYLVYPTDYLYLTSSKDGGATWSVPSLLNLKKESEQTLLVGPGRGIVTSKGRIVFTAYEFTGGDRNSVCFYSDDQGVTWTRGESVSEISSEAAVVEAEGKLYMFTRHGGYYVSEDWGETWSPKKEVGVSYTLSCELSAITYSKKIDGKTAIILSAPTSGRAAGKLFVALVQNDGTLSWDYDYSVNGSAYYAYSCLTELKDGSVGLLYENGGAAITYTNIPISDIAEDAVISNIWCEDADGNTTGSIDMKSDASVTLNVFDTEKDAVLTAVSSDATLLNVSLDGQKLTITSKAVTDGLARGYVTLTDGTNTAQLLVNITDSQQYEIVDLRMGDTKTFTIAEGSLGTVGDAAIAKVTNEGTQMTIEALLEGMTSVVAGGTEYFIVVKNDVKELKLEEGESVIVKGASILQEADQNVAQVEKNLDRPPYAKTDGVTADGKYLIGTASHIMVYTDSAASDPVGRMMKSVNFKAEDLTDYMWTIQASDGGYTFQDKNGQYLNFADSTGSSCAVSVSSTPQVLKIVESSDGYSITNTKHYLNNYANSNTRAAGWNANNSAWYFYQVADSFLITGIAEGRTSVIISGTTYHITVGNPKTVEEEKALAELKEKTLTVDRLLKQSALYTEESIKALTEAYKAAKALLDKEEEQNADTLKAALDTLSKAVDNLVKKQTSGQTIVPPPEKKIPEVGSIHSDAKASYKVLSATESGGTVSYVKPNKKTNKKITVPATIKIDGRTYKVTEIGNNAFKGNKNLTQITVGSNVKKIGKSAFEKCAKLKKITVKSKVLKSVGKQAVKGINKKCVIKVPKQKLAAYKKLFKGKGLKSTMKIKK